jgi:CubicO group peptidase (beta-lactamase class C family)
MLRRSFLLAAAARREYWPPPDRLGGWRAAPQPKLDAAFDYVQATTKNGGLAVVHRGWLIYERYFGRGHREAAPNLASCGKSVTSIAVGTLFAKGLDERVWEFPVDDPRRRDIRLGHLLAMTAGIRGNNPCYVHGREVRIEPPGPDGWQACVDQTALATPLWCAPGEGYSYATASPHIASMILRRAAGMELEEYVRRRIAAPLGWSGWGWGYRRPELRHTPGGGGIALRATDMLRFGYLLLGRGKWDGRQLVSAEYVRHCGQRSPFNPHFPYSLQFNIGGIDGVPGDVFWKSGSGGHCLYVVPSRELVVFKLGGRDGQYDPRDTGVPAAPATSGRPPDWSTRIPPEEALAETLRLVLGNG